MVRHFVGAVIALDASLLYVCYYLATLIGAVIRWPTVAEGRNRSQSIFCSLTRCVLWKESRQVDGYMIIVVPFSLLLFVVFYYFTTLYQLTTVSSNDVWLGNCEWWLGRDVEGNGRGLFWGAVSEFSHRDWEQPQERHNSRWIDRQPVDWEPDTLVTALLTRLIYHSEHASDIPILCKSFMSDEFVSVIWSTVSAVLVLPTAKQIVECYFLKLCGCWMWNILL